MLTLAIVGRPNVGKSTLFNKLTLGKKTIVHDFPGVTRDYTINQAQLGHLKFDLIDSAGLLDKFVNSLEKDIFDKTIDVLKTADALLFVVDGQSGLTANDSYVAKLVRKTNKPVLLIVNKCESKKSRESAHDFDKLGFSNIAYISAEHKQGFADLLEELLQFESLAKDNDDTKDKQETIKLAIIGKPNTGKSTLINRILNEERLLSGPEAGVTRDAVISKKPYKDYVFDIIDTAGLRKKSKITKDTIEQYSVSQTIATLNTANIVILLNDVNEPLQKQDLKIANLAINEGKPIILAYNKVDLFKDLDQIKEKLANYAHEVINNLKIIPTIYLSALHDKKFDKILDKAIYLYKKWNIQIPKKELNEWLEFATEQHPPPLSKSGRTVKLKFVRQIAARPPTFKIFGNITENLPLSYLKYLQNSLQKSFEIEDVPVRVEMKKNFNPYDTKS